MAEASAAVGRRKASALRSARAASDDAAQDLRLSALCLPLFFGGEHFVPFVTKARAQVRRENEPPFHLSPEGRGRVSGANEGEGVRKLEIFLVRPSPLTPPSPLRGRGSRKRRAHGIAFRPRDSGGG